MAETASCSPLSGGELLIPSSISDLIQGDVPEHLPMERIPSVWILHLKCPILEDEWLQGNNCRELNLEISA
jgi:hypothetical protein